MESADDTQPKYLNTPETEIFNKRSLLFGLDKSNRAISAAGVAIVVEGYMDAISLFSAGVKNVVATLGTAFTNEHAKLILKYARKIIFCYDSDEAGQRATLRALPIVQGAGANVFVAKVPDGKDPDEFIRKHGKAAFDELVNNAQTLIDYRMNYVLARADTSIITGKLTALREILPVVANIKGDTLRNEYKKKIAAALILDEQTILNEWDKISREPREKFSSPKAKPLNNQDRTVKEACETILRMIWYDEDMLDYVLVAVPREFFTETQQEIIKRFEICKQEGRRLDKISAANELSEAENTELSRILLSGSDDPRDKEVKFFVDAIAILQRAVLKKKYENLLAQADEYNSSDEESYRKKVHESLNVKSRMDSLKKV